MKYICAALFFFTTFACKKETVANNITMPPTTIPPIVEHDSGSKHFRYLALGDSYTIGHGVPSQENYPNQTINLLQKDSLFGEVKIIATTGWTTFNLTNAIEADQSLQTNYDIVTLLIGVNNQYQQIDINKYKPSFEELLKKALFFSGSKPHNVIVLSIPDWGVTPFAGNRDKAEIAKEIDAYNAINKSVSDHYGVEYIDITPWTRQAAQDPTLLATDGLHPSGKEYARWSQRIAEMVKGVLR